MARSHFLSGDELYEEEKLDHSGVKKNVLLVVMRSLQSVVHQQVAALCVICHCAVPSKCSTVHLCDVTNS